MMATNLMPADDFSAHKTSEFSLWNGVKQVLEPFASLKLTVILFAMSIFLILAGTLAQVDKDIWEVISLYFRCWFAWIPLQVFFPRSFFIDDPLIVPGGFYFSGGKLLGLLLAVNLASAHLVRFKAAASGMRLAAGFLGIGLGCLATWAIVVAGGNSKGIQGDPFLSYSTQWIAYQGLLAFGVLVCGTGFVYLCQKPLSGSSRECVRQLFLRGLLAVAGVGLAGLVTWMILRGEEKRPSDASMRILWQLAQGATASLALLGGCWTVFGKRAGIVLLHGGVGLMMFYELHVALTAVETQMIITEGERTNFVQDIRTAELAIIDTFDPKQDRVVAIPKSLLSIKNVIDTPELPFTIEVLDFVQNARLRAASSKDRNLATAGNGVIWFAEPARSSSGTDNDSKVDTSALYVKLTSKSGQKSLGTYLVSATLWMLDETDLIQVDGKSYQLELRPKRYYKPYRFELIDVKKEDYLGTSTPRNYASKVHILDSSRNVDEEKTIWMNNPLRFADETFYQSGYARDPRTGVEQATLSVVANSGWMMPYVGCMLVGIGMLVHFCTLLVHFLARGDESSTRMAKLLKTMALGRYLVWLSYLVDASEDSTDVAEESTSSRAAALANKLGMKGPRPQAVIPEIRTESSRSTWLSTAFTSIVVVSALGYIASKALPPGPKEASFDLYRFGQIPVVSEGRTKPIDTAARTALLTISGRTFLDTGSENDKQRIPAVKWLLEVITDAPVADDREVFRVENLELQETIGVKKREGMRYSRRDIDKKAKEFQEQVELARAEAKKDRKTLGVYKKKVLELSDKVATYDNLKFAFGLQRRITGKTQEKLLQSFQMATEFSEALEEQGQPVFAVIPSETDERWHILSRAWLLDLPNRIKKNGQESTSVESWEQLMQAFTDDKATSFNTAAYDLLKQSNSRPLSDLNPKTIQLESYFNQFQPFTHAGVLYLVAFVLGACGWLVWARGFDRAAFSLLLITFVLHSVALYWRLVISGRPPVTNLYSSAVFVGWGCVLFGLVFEFIYRIGIGNIVAAMAGLATMLIADRLALDGDTFTVLQAVLDTQFWLATHVTCITLGYATTYLAGLLGIVYVVRGVCTPSMTDQMGRDIHRMIYGTLCFSILFSFVGTVLGGLWADDSWGRFWGWDPKENAALMIVLWNALALHARWGGMAKERGLALLAVGGNIFVSWSWWGVNALGVGLHSYGFNEGPLRYLGLFILFNLAIISLGAIPKRLWWSTRHQKMQA